MTNAEKLAQHERIMHAIMLCIDSEQATPGSELKPETELRVAFVDSKLREIIGLPAT